MNDTPDPAEGTAPAQAPTGSRSDQVYRRLRALLMDGAIAPTERLAEEALAERFAVSRTPVREALTRLLSDDLVERREGGIYLHVPSLDSIGELYELRITLELRGIQRVIDDRTIAYDLRLLGSELDLWRGFHDAPPETDASFVDVDEGFHVSLLQASGNAALVEALRSVNRRIRPVRMYDYLTEDRIEATVREHLGIGELVLHGELTEALGALRAHVVVSREVVLERAMRTRPANFSIAGFGRGRG